jgi:hypothetical protein
MIASHCYSVHDFMFLFPYWNTTVPRAPSTLILKTYVLIIRFSLVFTFNMIKHLQDSSSFFASKFFTLACFTKAVLTQISYHNSIRNLFKATQPRWFWIQSIKGIDSTFSLNTNVYFGFHFHLHSKWKVVFRPKVGYYTFDRRHRKLRA